MIDNVLDTNSDLTPSFLSNFIGEVTYPSSFRFGNRPVWRRDRYGEWWLYAHVIADRDIARDVAVGFLDFMPDGVAVEVSREGTTVHVTVRK